MARKKALDDIVEVKVQQILAKEKGIIESTDYREFLKELENDTLKLACKMDSIRNETHSPSPLTKMHSQSPLCQKINYHA